MSSFIIGSGLSIRNRKTKIYISNLTLLGVTFHWYRRKITIIIHYALNFTVDFGVTIERTLVSNTTHEVRLNQRRSLNNVIIQKEVRGYDVIEGDMNIRRREGHEWAVGVASRCGVNGTTDILWIESRRPLSWARRRCARAAPRRWAQLGPGAGSGPGGSDAPTEHGGARAGSAQLTYRDVSVGGRSDTRRRPPLRAGRSSPHAPIPISAKVRAITTLRINYSCCYLKIFVCDAERSQPAARADTELHTRTASPLRGDWWGQAAPAPAEAPTHAHTAARPFPRVRRRCGASGTTTTHYHSGDSWTPIDRVVGTKYSTFTSQRTRARALIAYRQFPTHAQSSQIASRHRRAAVAPRRCATFDNFSRKLTCTVTVAEARRVPRGCAGTSLTYHHTDTDTTPTMFAPNKPLSNYTKSHIFRFLMT